jgi:hypothetical protein
LTGCGKTTRAGADALARYNGGRMTNRTPEPGHILNEAINPQHADRRCPQCGSDYTHWHVENYDPIWQMGDVVCQCGARVRTYDAS